MIKEGRVHVNGMLAQKPATGVNADVSIRVTDSEEDHWASRGAHKLLGALAAFEPQGLSLDGKRVLDAGASTGGLDRKSTRLNSSHVSISYAVFCLKKKSTRRHAHRA